jgi:hypothetical protein
VTSRITPARFRDRPLPPIPATARYPPSQPAQWSSAAPTARFDSLDSLRSLLPPSAGYKSQSPGNIDASLRVSRTVIISSQPPRPAPLATRNPRRAGSSSQALRPATDHEAASVLTIPGRVWVPPRSTRCGCRAAGPPAAKRPCRWESAQGWSSHCCHVHVLQQGGPDARCLC